ncbi:MAG: DUF4031 domain-containing protein [Nannocystaceae bacterium]|nr:DUF4031 domain-containing protein [bacterium]
MAVYVDELRVWGRRPVATSHLTADTVEELHAFARCQRFPGRCWHRGSRTPHYDIDAQLRQRALASGAVFVPARQQARARLARRRARAVQE